MLPWPPRGLAALTVLLGAVLLGAVLLGTCTERIPQERVQIPLFVAGTAPPVEPLVLADGAVLTIERAELAFGPLYLCSGINAGDLCDAARLEWLDTVVIDLLNPEPQRAGNLYGVSGPVRSWMYDLGISSQLTASEPFVLDAAQQLNDASLAIEGRAELAGMNVPFRAEIPIQQTTDTEQGVPVIRKSPSTAFLHEVTADESGLLLRFDLFPSLEDLQFSLYLEQESCQLGLSETLCAGMFELRCSSAGLELSRRDCAVEEPAGQVCLKNLGCQDSLVFQLDHRAYRVLSIALMTAIRPTFRWGFSP